MGRGNRTRTMVVEGAAQAAQAVQPVSVGYLDRQAELFHATAFVHGLRARELRERLPRVTLIDRMLGRVEIKRNAIEQQWRHAHLHLRGMIMYSIHARAVEQLAEELLRTGRVTR